MAGLSSKKLFIAFMAMLSMFFLAMVFQNFTFKKDDYNDVYSALQGAVKSSDEEHAIKRKTAEPQENTGAGREINAIHDQPGVGIDDLEPVSIELNDKSLKQ